MPAVRKGVANRTKRPALKQLTPITKWWANNFDKLTLLITQTSQSSLMCARQSTIDRNLTADDTLKHTYIAVLPVGILTHPQRNEEELKTPDQMEKERKMERKR